MHPINYDLVIRHQQFELDRATRKATWRASLGFGQPQEPTPPRQEGGLRSLFVRILIPQRTQRASAEP
jgi:hypothetical protein